jgi:hypothetical protein
MLPANSDRPKVLDYQRPPSRRKDFTPLIHAIGSVYAIGAGIYLMTTLQDLGTNDRPNDAVRHRMFLVAVILALWALVGIGAWFVDCRRKGDPDIGSWLLMCSIVLDLFFALAFL